MSEAPLIEIHNATIWRGSTRVFHDFSLTIEQHERVALLGPNGSGKTTLLKTINRELYPVAGSDSWIRILGREHWNVWDLRGHIGLVSPDLQYGFHPEATVLDAIVSGYFASIGVDSRQWARLDAAQLARAEAVLEALHLESLRERAYRTLSTGQQRRCLLGRALVHEPATLILDEPTSGLDLTASFEFMERIRQLVQRGSSLVLVTHQLNEIPPEVARVIVLKEGKVVADGAKSSVLTADLLSKVYGVNVRVTEVDGHFLAY
jgi:iron complex transport system ATP-binding protein